jgi:hypothetical protein
MPCFAHLPARRRDEGRKTWRALHVMVGIMFVPFFVLALALTLSGGSGGSGGTAGTVLLGPVVVFWLALVGWFCFVPLNVGRGDSEDMAVSCTLYAVFAFMCAIVVTLFAYGEIGGSGAKMVPLFVLAARGSCSWGASSPR